MPRILAGELRPARTCMVHMRAESIMSKIKVVVKGAPDSGG